MYGREIARVGKTDDVNRDAKDTLKQTFAAAQGSRRIEV